MEDRGGQSAQSTGEAPSGGAPPLADAIAEALESMLKALPAEGIVIVRTGSEGRAAAVIAAAPAPLASLLADGRSEVPWVGRVLNATVATGTASESLETAGSLYDAAGPRTLLTTTLVSGERAAPSLLLAAVARVPTNALAAVKSRLELGARVIQSLDLRAKMQGQEQQVRRLAGVIDAAAMLGDARGFQGAAMSLCNDAAARFSSDRVSLGFLRGPRVRLAASSHSEALDRRSRLVQSIEEVMEECADQDCEITHPGGAASAVTRCVDSYAPANGMRCVASLPIRTREQATPGGGKGDSGVRAVMTLERTADRPFTQAELIDLRMVLDVIAPGLVRLHETDRWVGARLAYDLKRLLAAIVGPTHTWAKALALATTIFLACTMLIKGTYKVEGTFTLDVPRRLSVPAPFDGFLREASAKPNDRVTAGTTLLARLDDSDLKVEAASLAAEREARLTEASKARNERKMSEAQVSEAEAAKASAKLDLIRSRIAKASVVSPVTGVVLVGDLEKLVGSPVKTGDVLYEVAPEGTLHADVAVPEDQIADVEAGQTGELATAAYPGRHIAFEVERLDPIATIDQQRNVFSVRVRLTDIPPEIAQAIRPGMQGVAKIDADRRPYLSIWTRRLVNWVRMKLWI